jgi:hypothetical protein
VGMEGFDFSNSIDFIQKVKDIVLQDDEILMYFDVNRQLNSRWQTTKYKFKKFILTSLSQFVALFKSKDHHSSNGLETRSFSKSS